MYLRSLLLIATFSTASLGFGQSASDIAAFRTPVAATAPTVVPALVLYADVALAGDGKPLAGEMTVTFLLFTSESGGDPLWMESQRVLADATGHYRVQLGSSSPNGLPLEVFSTGEARWLEVQIAGQKQQARVLLSSVPYAAKAADAATLGGLPASAFMRVGAVAAVAVAGPVAAADGLAGVVPDAASAVTTTGGTSKRLPLFSGATTIVNSEIYDTGASVGVGGTPSSTVKLDVLGASIFRGNTTVNTSGVSTASKGYPSFNMNFYASAYSSSTKAATTPYFGLRSEPTGNDTATPSATFNLLFAKSGAGVGTAAETGFYFNPTGLVHFATGQTFPGAVTSVKLTAPTTDFKVTGSPVTSAGTLGLSWTVVPTSDLTANAIVKRDAGGSFQANNIVSQTMSVENGLTGFSGDASGSAVTANNYDGGTGLTATGATGIHASGSNYSIVADSNVQQARTANGFVKAMAYVDELHTPYAIKECFNSTMAGAAATTPPCGIDLEEVSVGEFNLTFNFQINDRFFSATAGSGQGQTMTVQPQTNTELLTEITNKSGDLVQGTYWLMVY